jgi:hypothetical protein
MRQDFKNRSAASTAAERVQTQYFEKALPRYADRESDRDAFSTNDH